MIRILLLLTIAAPCAVMADSPPVADTPYAQEYAEHYPWPEAAGALEPTALLVQPERMWAATAAGLWRRTLPEGAWEPVALPHGAGAVFDLAPDAAGEVLAAAWSGLYRIGAGDAPAPLYLGAPMAAVAVLPSGVVQAWGPDGTWRSDGDGGLAPLPCAGNVRDVAVEADGTVWLATGMGLYRTGTRGGRLYQTPEEIVSSDVRAVLSGGLSSSGQRRIVAGGLGGLSLYDGESLRGRVRPDPLPSAEVQCAALGHDGSVWIGTPLGAARPAAGGHWALRHSRRWLLDDDVRAIAAGPDGAMYFATPKGVSALRTRTMTLAEKAAHFLEATKQRHIRAPYIVEKCRLERPGDLASWQPEDDDNDGSYTGLFCVAESYRYAVTGDAEARANADRAFDFLEFLQTVTGTPGFVARTVAPADWTRMHDGNETVSPERRARERVEDPRSKPVEVRWRPSADGQWLWKGDTSSDEITGHFYTYAEYYDLAADEAQQEKVRSLTRRLMDHIVDNGYLLVDPIDGRHTRWGVWAPERLNGDPNWRAERGINALEILSYLKTAHHITGDAKYQEAYLDLLHNHGYLDHVRDAKTYAPAWVTHIDTELLAMAYPALLRYETDPALLERYRESLDIWYRGVRGEQNPYAEMIYVRCTGTPQAGDAVEVLRTIPLDLISWSVSQQGREDLRAVRAPILEDWNMDRLVPADERPTIRWDKNVWAMSGGEGGATEWAPTFWLLPYWMARHLGVIE